MRPVYEVLTQQDVEMIHETSLRILEEVGVVFQYEPALRLLEKHGAKVDGEIVRFPRQMVEEKIKTVPQSFMYHARNPEKSFEVNLEDTHYASPCGAPFVIDLDRGRRESTLDDFNEIIKICHMLPNLDVHSNIPCEVTELGEKPTYRRNLMTYNTLKYSDKPLMGSVDGYESGKQSIELAAIANGGFDELNDRTVIGTVPCPASPLLYDANMAGAIMVYAEYNQMNMILSFPTAGTTGPVTVAGCAALMNAEDLAGIILSQCVRPGSPVLYSSGGTSADLFTAGVAIGAPEASILSLITGQLARYYNIPSSISTFLSDARSLDSQAAFESALTGAMAELTRGNMNLHIGMIESYMTVSYEKLILDDLLIGELKRICSPVKVDEETLVFDLIKKVGPQGEFITDKHTARNFRKNIFYSPMIDRSPIEKWQKQGALTFEQKANLRWKELLEKYEEPGLDPELDKEMQKYLK